MTSLLVSEFLDADSIAARGDLLNRCFPVPAGASFFDDFPIWSLPSSVNVRHFGIVHEGRCVSTASVRFATLKPSGVSVSVLGAVATDPGFRGQGLARGVIERCLEASDRARAECTLLWGSEADWYATMGFQLKGLQLQQLASLSPAIMRAGRLEKNHSIANGWSEEFLRLMRARSHGFFREPADLAWLSRHKNVQWRSLWRGDELRAFLAFDRGIDLGSRIHEWGGEDEGVAQLARAAIAERPDLIWLLHPDYHANLWDPSKNAEKGPLLLARAPGALPAFLDTLWVWGLDAA